MDISLWQKTWNKIIYGWDLNDIGTSLMVVPDVSHWSINADLKIDEAKFEQQINEKKVKAIVYKGTDFNRSTKKMFRDSTAPFWWKLAKKYGLLTGSYHWLQGAVDPTVAFEFHEDFISEYPTDFHYIVDFEEPSITDYSDYIWRLEVWTALAEDRLVDDKPIIYTGAWYLDRIRLALGSSNYNKKMSKFSDYPAWFALYSRYFPKRYCQIISKKESFYPWDSNDWVMWQYSDAADFPYYKDDDKYNGQQWGIPSKGLDMNFVKIDWLKKYLSNYCQDSPNVSNNEDDSNLEDVVPDKYVITATLGLIIRESPTINSLRIGSFSYKNEVLIKSVDENNWGKLYDRDGYIYLKYTTKIVN
jgi:hypothetical protein